MPMLPEFQAMYSEILKEIGRMEVADLQKLAKLLVTSGTATSAIRAYPTTEIFKKGTEVGAKTAAELGVKSLEFEEERSRFEKQLAEQRRQFEIQAQLNREAMEYNKEQIRLEEEERKRAAGGWWKSLLGGVLGVALPGVGGLIGKAIGLGGRGGRGAGVPTGQLTPPGFSPTPPAPFTLPASKDIVPIQSMQDLYKRLGGWQ